MGEEMAPGMESGADDSAISARELVAWTGTARAMAEALNGWRSPVSR